MIETPNTAIILPSAETQVTQPADGNARVRSYIGRSKAASTQRIYRSDWQQFCTWCIDHRYEPELPTSATVIAQFLSDLADDGSKISTIRRKLAAIAFAHKAAGVESATSSQLVTMTLEGIHRTIGVPAKQKKAVRLADLRAMVMTLPATVRGLRDRAMLLLGFAGAFRRSELVALDIEDIEEEDDGLRITLRRSKTDQLGVGYVKGIPAGSHLETCPVRAYLAWIEAAHISSGAVFRAVDRHGHISARRADERAVARAVQDAARAAGLNPRQFAGHSLRAGLVTAADKAGVAITDIMAQTGHKRVDTVLKYVRGKNVLGKANAARKVGL